MLQGGTATAEPPSPERPASVKDEVLGMLQTAPEPTASLPARVGGALTDQAGRMGKFFTEGLPEAARTTVDTMRAASTAPTLGQSLRQRGQTGSFGERVAFGGLSPIPSVVDLAERFNMMASAIGRGAGMLGPLARPGHPDPLTEAAVNAALPMAPTLLRGGASALRGLRRGPPLPPEIPNPLEGDISGLRPSVARPALPEAQIGDIYRGMGVGPEPGMLALPPAPPEILKPPIPQPPVPAPRAQPYEGPPPVIRGTRIAPPEESLLVPRRTAEPSPVTMPTAEEVAFRRAGGDPTIPPERPTRFVDAQGRPIMEPQPGFRPRKVGEPPQIPQETAPTAPPGGVEAPPPREWTVEEVEVPPETAPAPPKPPQAPPEPPRLPEPPPEASPALELKPPPPPKPPRIGTSAGANPEFQAAKQQWQERLAKIDAGTVNLTDPDEVFAFIKGVGRIQRASLKDFPDIPHYFRATHGKQFDEIVQEIADAQHKPVRVVETQLANTLMRYKHLRDAKRARLGAGPRVEPEEPGGPPPTTEEYEQAMRADPLSQGPDWLRGVVPPIPLPDLPPEEQDTTKGRLYRALQVVGLAAPAIGMAAGRFRGRRPTQGALPGAEEPGGLFNRHAEPSPAPVASNVESPTAARVRAARARLDRLAAEMDRGWSEPLTGRPQPAPMSNVATHPEWGQAMRDLKAAERDLAREQRAVPPAPLKVEGSPSHPSPPRPPSARWMNDPGAIPGEGALYLDGDATTARAAVIERPLAGSSSSAWEAMLPGGRSLGRFDTLEEAARAAEGHFPPRFERTAMGDQALIPGAESRAIPEKPVTSERPQKPVEDLPLFGQEKASREASAAKAQRSLFDYLSEEHGAINPNRRAGASPPAMGARPPQVPQEFRSEKVGGGEYRPPAPPQPAPTPEPSPSTGASVERPSPETLAKPGALRGLREYMRQAYSPVISQFERMGPAGKEVSRRVQETESAAQRWYGQHIDPIVREAKRLSAPEAENFREVAEGTAQAMNPRVAALQTQYERVFGTKGVIPKEAGKRNLVVMDTAGEARPFQARQQFFPHEFSPEVSREIRERGPAYDRAITYLLDTGQAHDAETAAAMLAERFNFKRTTLGDRVFLLDPDRFVGGLERARDIDLPDFIKDPATAIAARGMKVARRFAELDHYGRLDAEIGSPGGYIDPLTNRAVPAHGLIGEIQKTQGREAANHAATLFQQVLGHQEYTPFLSGKLALARGINSFEAFTKLPLAAVANASQFAQVAARTNLTTAAKGVASSLTRAGREAASDLGVISEMSLKQLYEDVSGSQSLPGKAMRVAMGPFNVVEKWDRIVGANAGLSWARTIEGRLASGKSGEWMARELERLNFSPEEAKQAMATGGLTDEQRSRIAWAITDQTQFLGRRYRRSEFFNTPIGSIIGQFKSFSLNAGRMLKQSVLDEARHGNLAPLARVAALFPLVGEAVQDTKAILRGTERPDSPIARALDNVMAVGGMGLAADFVQSLSRLGSEGALSWLAGPALTDATQLAARTYRLGQSLGQGDEDKIGKRAQSLARFGARQIPFVGPSLDTAMREDPAGQHLQEMSVSERLRLP